MIHETVTIYRNIHGRSALWTRDVASIPHTLVFDEPLHVAYRSIVEAFYRLRQACEGHGVGTWSDAIALAQEGRNPDHAGRYFEAVEALLVHWGVEPKDLPRLGLDLRPYMFPHQDHHALSFAVRDRWMITP